MNHADRPPLREFHVTVICDNGKSMVGYTAHFPDAYMAAHSGMASGGIGSRVVARPAIELTENEGLCRWPEELHPKASTEAYSGWLRASVRAVIASKDWASIDRHHAEERAAGFDSVECIELGTDKRGEYDAFTQRSV